NGCVVDRFDVDEKSGCVSNSFNDKTNVPTSNITWNSLFGLEEQPQQQQEEKQEDKNDL
ncbi:unnamed protein product, partial [Adineta steineri]